MVAIATTPWTWVALGLALAAAEMLAPGYFLIWLAMAALMTGLTGLLLELPFAAMAGLFALLAALALALGRAWYRRTPVLPADPSLNDRGGQLVGQTAVVTMAIAGGMGRVRHGDTEWLAQGTDAETGARVRIVGHNGTVLVVEPEG